MQRFLSTTIPKRNLLTQEVVRNFRAAVVFHGCGVYDGTETTEAVAMLCELSRLGAEVQVFAPNRNQAHVVNHLTGDEQNQTRNLMEESARISRGDCKDLNTLEVSNFDALLIPGGFGAAKNLSDFGFKGAEMKVDEDVERIMQEFHTKKKVIGLTCISPILAAKVFGPDGVKLTLGGKGENWPYAGSLDAAQSFGAKIEEMNVDQVCTDWSHEIITTPAYMQGNAKPHEVLHGVQKFVRKVHTVVQ